MRCIYLTKNEFCRASPIIVSVEADLYKPEAEVLSANCNKDFKGCQRLQTFQEHLKAANK